MRLRTTQVPRIARKQRPLHEVYPGCGLVNVWHPGWPNCEHRLALLLLRQLNHVGERAQPGGVHDCMNVFSRLYCA